MLLLSVVELVSTSGYFDMRYKLIFLQEVYVQPSLCEKPATRSRYTSELILLVKLVLRSPAQQTEHDG